MTPRTAAPAAAADPEAEWARMAELARAATPGPWFQSGRPWFNDGSTVLAGSDDPHAGQFIADTGTPDADILGQFPNAEADAAYIAAASPDRLLRLLRERDRLREQAAKAAAAAWRANAVIDWVAIGEPVDRGAAALAEMHIGRLFGWDEAGGPRPDQTDGQRDLQAAAFDELVAQRYFADPDAARAALSAATGHGDPEDGE